MTTNDIVGFYCPSCGSVSLASETADLRDVLASGIDPEDLPHATCSDCYDLEEDGRCTFPNRGCDLDE